jgi:hypothetical protein
VQEEEEGMSVTGEEEGHERDKGEFVREGGGKKGERGKEQDVVVQQGMKGSTNVVEEGRGPGNDKSEEVEVIELLDDDDDGPEEGEATGGVHGVLGGKGDGRVEEEGKEERKGRLGVDTEELKSGLGVGREGEEAEVVAGAKPQAGGDATVSPLTPPSQQQDGGHR